MYSMYKITLSIVPANLLLTHLNSTIISPAPGYQDNLSTDLYENQLLSIHYLGSGHGMDNSYLVTYYSLSHSVLGGTNQNITVQANERQNISLPADHNCVH
jgi:hypothetical protein